MKNLSFVTLSLFSLTLLGCGGAPSAPVDKLVPVAGTLTIDGKPTEGVSLLFFASDNSPTRGGGARTDAQGKFTVTHNATNKPGLPAGSYTVIYTLFTKPDGTPVPLGTMPANVGAMQRLPAVWNDLSKAGPHNQLVIPAEGSPNLDLKVDTKLRARLQ